MLGACRSSRIVLARGFFRGGAVASLPLRTRAELETFHEIQAHVLNTASGFRGLGCRGLGFRGSGVFRVYSLLRVCQEPLPRMGSLHRGLGFRAPSPKP